MPSAVERDARQVLVALGREWSEVAPTEVLRKRAERLLGMHVLRSADALQLAAALIWSRDDQAAHAIVSLDERLRGVSALEGLQVLPLVVR